MNYVPCVWRVFEPWLILCSLRPPRCWHHLCAAEDLPFNSNYSQSQTILSSLWQASLWPRHQPWKGIRPCNLSSPSEKWHCSQASSSLASILPSLVAAHDLMLLWFAQTSLSGPSSWEENVSLKWYLPYGISRSSKPVPHHISCSVSLKEITSSRPKAVWIQHFKND